MFDEIRGERTDRAWSYDVVRDRLEAPGSGERFRATATDDGSLACIHRCERGGMWEDDVDRLRVAIAVASRPEVVAASTIRQLVDVRETKAVSGEFGSSGSLVAIWEWGSYSAARSAAYTRLHFLAAFR